MVTELEIGGVHVDVVRKDIKNLHLSVYPPTGRVRIAAPTRTSMDTIRAFAITRLVWIRRHQRKVTMQERETPREYIDRESHYVWGERVLLMVVTKNEPPKVTRQHKTLVMQVRPDATTQQREDVLEAWYREELRSAAAPLVDKWQAWLSLEARAIYVQRMRTKWGSCNTFSRNIRLNTDLAKKPPECLDYVVLHELAHLKVRLHTSEFFTLLDHAMPQWREIRKSLNVLPLRAQ